MQGYRVTSVPLHRLVLRDGAEGMGMHTNRAEAQTGTQAAQRVASLQDLKTFWMHTGLARPWRESKKGAWVRRLQRRPLGVGRRGLHD